MSFLIQNNFLNVSGVLTAAQVNTLGTTPFVFNTPANFYPVGFALKAESGAAQPAFSSKLCIITIDTPRILYLGTDPAVFGFTNFFGMITNVLFTPQFGEATNIELLPNNFNLTPEDFTDPTPGDYTYKYNFYGFVL